MTKPRRLPGHAMHSARLGSLIADDGKENAKRSELDSVVVCHHELLQERRQSLREIDIDVGMDLGLGIAPWIPGVVDPSVIRNERIYERTVRDEDPIVSAIEVGLAEPRLREGR